MYHEKSDKFRFTIAQSVKLEEDHDRDYLGSNLARDIFQNYSLEAYKTKVGGFSRV